MDQRVDVPWMSFARTALSTKLGIPQTAITGDHAMTDPAMNIKVASRPAQAMNPGTNASAESLKAAALASRKPAAIGHRLAVMKAARMSRPRVVSFEPSVAIETAIGAAA